MYPTRRVGLALAFLFGFGFLGSGLGFAAGEAPISIRDWQSGTASSKAETADDPAEASSASSENSNSRYPAEAFMPAVEDDGAASSAVEQSPLPPQENAALTEESKTVSETKSGDAGGAEPILRDAQNASDPPKDAPARAVRSWVAQNEDQPTSSVTEAATGERDSGGEIKAGQIRTPTGVIDLQAITLDRLHEELAQETPREEMRISLQDCVALALKSNQDIIVSSYEPLKSDGDIMQAKGEFDPVLRSIALRSHSENAASSQTSAFTGGALGGGSGGLLSGLGSSGGSGGLGSLGGGGGLLGSLSGGGGLLSGLGNSNGSGGINWGRILLSAAMNLASSASGLIQNFIGGGETSYVLVNDVWRSETTLSGKIPWGTQYELKMEVTDEETTFNNFISEYSGGLTLTVTQPLLKGRGPRANLARIRIAKNNREVAEAQLMTQVMNTLSEVVKAYWDLEGARQQLEVREKSLANAERLLDINERRMEIGTGAALEVVQAKASVAQRQGDVISARSQVRTAEDRLKLLLNMRDDQTFSSAKLLPTDKPAATELDLDETESINRALDNRPEMQSAKLEIDSATIEKYRSANDMLPQLDVAGSVFQGARGPKANDVFEGVLDRSDNSWSLQLTGSVPIPNRSGRGAYEKANLSKRQAEERLKKTISELTLNVRNSLRGVGTTRILVESSKQARALQETNVMAEEKRLKLGVTTSFEVLRTQEDLATAQAQEVQALIDFEKAKVDLELAEGVLLPGLGVEYQMPEPEKPISFLRSIVPPAPRD